MSKPSWQDALPKKAVILQKGPDGKARVVASGEGAAAEEIIARAQAAGVEVRQNADEVNQLLRKETPESNIPPEIYEIMAEVIQFAQELNEQWPGRPLDEA